jgi:parallel beta-helix repeat protein/predicted outer membrane repeat protein
MKLICTRPFLFILSLFVSFQSFSNQITVCSSSCNHSTIAAAVAAASAGDTIVISGTITESNIIVSKNLTFLGQGMYATIVQGSATRGAAAHRVFRIGNGASVTFRDLTVQHGREGTSDPAGYNSSGGAFLIDGTNTTLTLVNVDVKDNDNGSTSGGAGGAIGLFGTSTVLNLYNCRVEGSTSPTSAGALYLSATNGVVDAKNTVFDNNVATSGSGGAIFLGGTISSTYSNCTFSNNKANGNNSGGAVYGNSAYPVFTNCTFVGNTATTQGGALRVGPATLTNCTFYQNTATTLGGAIFRSGTNVNPLVVVNCTIYGNSGSAGGGVYYNSTANNINLVNSVLASNTGGDLYVANSSNLTVNQQNYVGSAAFGTGSASFAYTSGALNITTPLASNGGLTQTLSVGTGSVLINNGASSVSGITIPAKDQRNYNRSGSVDIGSFDAAASDALSIYYTQLGNATSAANRVLSATIADATAGIPTSGAFLPRIYFRKNSGAWQSAAGTLAAGTSNSGTWDFTIDHVTMGGVAQGDVISYFVTAQDNSSGSFAKSNLSGLVAADVTAVATAPTPDVYTVTLSTLPIKLLSFEAAKQGGNNVLLTWKVMEEEDADSYEVLRSNNHNSHFRSIATVPAKGLSSYSVTDKNISGTVYYQLKNKTKNGVVTYSKVISVTTGETLSVQLRPNVVTTDHAVLSVTSSTSAQAVYVVVDLAGREVLKRSIGLQTGHNNITVPLQQVGKGQYFLQLFVGNAKPQTLPFIRN